jgi:tryptophan synthase alpha subunit
VVNFKKFIFDKAIGRIVQQQTRKVPVTGGNPFSVITETMVTKDVIKIPAFHSIVGTAFIVATEQNLKNLFHLNEEKDARIRELEEQLRNMLRKMKEASRNSSHVLKR